jgi:hypothetical protein
MHVTKRETAAASGAAVAFGVLTVRLLLWDGDGTQASEKFIDSDRFRIWASLLCIQSAAWAVLLLVLGKSLRRLWRAHPAARRSWRRIALMSIAIVVLAFGFVVAYAPVAPYYPLTHRHLKLGVITAVGLLVALVAIIGMWLAAAALEGRSPYRRGGALSSYVSLRDELRRFLGFAAAIIGGAMLSTGALRGAVLASPDGGEFPAEYVLYYGAYFSALIAVAYAPAYLKFQRFGLKLVNALVPLSRRGTNSWAEWYAERKALEGFVGLEMATGKGLRGGLAIMAPLAGSAVGLLLGTGA